MRSTKLQTISWSSRTVNKREPVFQGRFSFIKFSMQLIMNKTGELIAIVRPNLEQLPVVSDFVGVTSRALKHV